MKKFYIKITDQHEALIVIADECFGDQSLLQFKLAGQLVAIIKNWDYWYDITDKKE